MISNAKSVFLGVYASGLMMLAAFTGTVLNPGYLASYWYAGFGRFLQVSALLPIISEQLYSI
jgi:hypothetical protein